MKSSKALLQKSFKSTLVNHPVLRAITCGLVLGAIFTSPWVRADEELRGLPEVEKPRFQLESYGGALGGSEQGFALNGHAEFRAQEGSWARLRGTIGAPLLQVNGRAEMIPVRLLRTPVETGNDHDLQFRLDIIPVSADAQVQAAIRSEGSNHHLIIDPKLAAELDWLSPESMRLGGRFRTTLSPAAGGVIRDGDGASGIFGVQVGVEGALAFSLSPQDELDFLCGVDVLTTVHDGVDPAATRSRCGLGYTRTLGQQGNLRVALVSEYTNLDVVRGSNRDSGETSFIGLGVTFTPSRSPSARTSE
jgi:hypothetical protein